MADARFITRVGLRNYKSIGSCSIELGPLTFLVGPNGSGKSNFLDALRFVTDSLRYSLEHALRDRGGIAEVRRRSSGHPTHFGIRLEYQLSEGAGGHYAFQIGARPAGVWEVQREECFVQRPGHGFATFLVESGELKRAPRTDSPAAFPDRLYLVNASGLQEFRPVYDSLSRMGFYNLNPDRIRDLQAPDPGEVLARDGSNLASVLAHLSAENRSVKERIEEYLAKVVPGVLGVDSRVIGPKETLEFRQRVAGSKDTWRFFAANMSDGTLHALGVLVSVFQSANGRSGTRVPLVGIEEPEIALHPGAAGVLLDSLRDAADHIQVLVTSHSGELLDDDDIPADSILAVQAVEGNTEVAPIDESGRSALRDRLYTAGELLRLNQIRPDPSMIDHARRQLRLFNEAEE